MKLQKIILSITFFTIYFFYFLNYLHLDVYQIKNKDNETFSTNDLYKKENWILIYKDTTIQQKKFIVTSQPFIIKNITTNADTTFYWIENSNFSLKGITINKQTDFYDFILFPYLNGLPIDSKIYPRNFNINSFLFLVFFNDELLYNSFSINAIFYNKLNKKLKLSSQFINDCMKDKLEIKFKMPKK